MWYFMISQNTKLMWSIARVWHNTLWYGYTKAEYLSEQHHYYHIMMNNLSTHWGRDKMAAIFQTTFSNACSWMKMYEFRLRFHWSFFPRVKLTIFHNWFRWWLDVDQATSHYLNQWWLVYWHICITRHQWNKNWRYKFEVSNLFHHDMNKLLPQ